MTWKSTQIQQSNHENVEWKTYHSTNCTWGCQNCSFFQDQMIPLLYDLSFVSFGTLYMTIPSQNLTDISEFQYALLLLPSNFMSILPVSSVFTKINCWLWVLDTSSTNQIVKQIISLLYNNQIVKQIIILVCNIKNSMISFRIWLVLLVSGVRCTHQRGRTRSMCKCYN